jgi:hypothetical protein
MSRFWHYIGYMGTMPYGQCNLKAYTSFGFIGSAYAVMYRHVSKGRLTACHYVVVR